MMYKNPIRKIVLLSAVFFLFFGGRATLTKDQAGSLSADYADFLPKRFTNPVANGADPWVIKHDLYYYTCQSSAGTNGKGISVSKSAQLTKPGPPVQVWNTPAAGWNSSLVWAPELHRIGNRWYIYYAAGKAGPPFIYQRSGVLESVTDDPQGKYIDKGMLKTGIDSNDSTGTVWAIDMTVSEIKGKLYGVWSGWEKNAVTDKTSQHLYIAEMSNPWTISTKRVKISCPDQPWERGGPLDLNEGPQFLKHNGEIFIIYSTRESWTPEYRLGQLRLKDTAGSVLDRGNWEKTGPVFQGTDSVAGTGHACFTTSPDGKEWWIYYHAKKSVKPGWQRNVRLQKFTWRRDGSPDFGIPVPTATPMNVPAGE
ncbi:MAG: glycoside hydrolase [Ferruginibacter sp.]|nr:glycoside hydrolase [Ferruginibacter sp.]